MQLDTLIAGDTLSVLVSLADYPASAGWVLKYRLVARTAGPAAISITATAENDDHRVSVAAGTTAAWTADNYSWASWVERAAEKYTVAAGQLVIQPDPRTLAAGYDGRSQARKALDQAKAALAAWTPTQRRYAIAGREMEFNSPSAIQDVINYWERQVVIEDRKAKLGAGAPDPRRVQVRLGRV